MNEKGRPGGPEIFFELYEILWAMFDCLAQSLAQIGRNLVHRLGLGAGNVVKLVSVTFGSLHEADGRRLAHVVRTDKGILAVPEARREASLLLDAARFVF